MFVRQTDDTIVCMVIIKAEFSIQPVDGRSRSQLVESALVDLIARGDLPAGARLPTEHTLAERFGVSRATVREAITRLRADGVLSTKPGRGAVVESATPSALRLQGPELPGSFEHLFELRRLIEVEAAALAAQRRTPATLGDIQRAHAAMGSAARSGLQAPEADGAFHRAVAAATGNPHLMSLLDFIGHQLDQLLARAWANSARVAGGAHDAQAEHELLVAAIRAGDAAAARHAAGTHLKQAEKRLTRAAPDGPQPAVRASAS
jgi:GntR family transcriptional repressor for pyruvate dehydrogenase complex